MLSIWKSESEMKKLSVLNEDISTDVLVIGGGITGVLCARMLSDAGVKTTLVEAKAIGSGVTCNTTAKITLQHGLLYQKIIEKYGVERAKQYLEANLKALKEYCKLCENIDCDYETKDSFVYSTENRDKLEKELDSFQQLGYPCEYRRDLKIPIKTVGAVLVKNQAQFNPLKFISVISDGLQIYENTLVEHINGTTAITRNGNKIKAKKIIVATHFPFINKHGAYFLKMYQHRSYVIALENAQNVDGMYVDEAQNGMSFRNHKNLLLVGGGDHRTGKKGGNWEELRRFASKVYPDAKEKFYWATQDCMTLDEMPYIGRYSDNTPNLFVATGFNKWGMTSSMVSSMVLCDMVQEFKNPYEELFSPSRSILHPQLLVNCGETLLNFVHPTMKRCPHLGCALKWNPYEHTWDCSCHGSRFTQEGKIIDNPATKDANI